VLGERKYKSLRLKYPLYVKAKVGVFEHVVVALIEHISG
jgi:hypothetical protein